MVIRYPAAVGPARIEPLELANQASQGIGRFPNVTFWTDPWVASDQYSVQVYPVVLLRVFSQESEW